MRPLIPALALVLFVFLAACRSTPDVDEPAGRPEVRYYVIADT